MVMTKKKTAKIEERYPVVEEGGGCFWTPPEPSKPPVKPESKILKGIEDRYLERIATYEVKFLANLLDVTRHLIKEGHPIGPKLAGTTLELVKLHEARNERIEQESYIQGLNARKRRIKVTKEELEADKSAWKAKYGTIRGWQSYALINFGIKDSRTLKKILE